MVDSPYRMPEPSGARRIFVPLVLLVLGGLAIWAVTVWARDELDVRRVTDEAAGSPTLILLHGYGAAGSDLVALGDELAPNLPGVQILVPAGPFHLVGSGRAWFVESPGEAVESRALLAKVIDDLLEEGTAPGDIVVAGFSQGGTMAADIGLFHPDVGCVAVISGRPLSGAGWGRKLLEGDPPGVLIAHGRKDRTVSLTDGRALAEMLEQAGAPVTFVEHDGAHEIPEAVKDRLVEFVQRCVD